MPLLNTGPEKMIYHVAAFSSEASAQVAAEDSTAGEQTLDGLNI